MNSPAANKQQRTLSFKLIGVTVLFVALTTLANGLYTITSERQVLLEQMDAQGKSLVRATSIFAVEPLLIRDYPVLETFAENITDGQHGILQVRIIRADGKIAVQALSEGMDSSNAQGFQTYAAPIRVTPGDAQDIGLVEIDISTSRSDSLVSQRLWTLGIASFVAFLTLGLMIALLIRRTVTQPLHSLATKAKALGHGDLNTRITLKTQDELGLLANTLDSMRHNLKRSYSEIDQQNQDLKELDRMKDEFLARISHEINTPLNGILGLCSALKKDNPEPLSTGLSEPIDKIQSSANRLQTLAKQLLSFHPPAERKNARPTAEIEFDCLLLALVDQHQPEMAHKGLASACDVEPGLRLRASADLLGRIFNNLLENATKFTTNGHVLLVAESIDNIGIAVSITDTGIGIAEELQTDIFERFHQGDSYETRDYEGAGIGLALVKQDVEFLGGRIILQSARQEGSCFTVILPVNDDVSIEQLATQWRNRQPYSKSQRHIKGHTSASMPPVTHKIEKNTQTKAASDPDKKTILVVDDDRINRTVLHLHLQSSYNIIEAEDGNRCLAILADNTVDLILLDLMMPKISGFDILEYIKNHPEQQYPRVIVVSALMDTKSISRALQAGAVDYLTKPFNNDELLARVHTHLTLADREFHLEQQVQHRTLQLQQANQLQAETFQQLVQSEKMSSLGLLTAGVAHEINNPISFIHSNLGILNRYSETFQTLLPTYRTLEEAIGTKNESKMVKTLEQLAQLHEQANTAAILEDMPELLSETLEGTKRVTKIVQGMKGFAHADKGAMVMEDINKGLEDTLNVTWNELKYKCTLHKSLGNLPRTCCHLGQLNQVFANLLINAAQSIDSSGVIEVTSEQVDNEIQVCISDTGPGIEKANIPHLFEPFFTTKPVGQGTGLGLYVSYEIIQQHKGSIAVQSEIGKGTTFTIRLPITNTNDETLQPSLEIIH